MEPVLSVHDLTKTFSRPGQTELTAVNHISFDLMPGECLGIIGERYVTYGKASCNLIWILIPRGVSTPVTLWN